tara:strand:+ start:87 stop:632 length:546 start_codon:yes stop_codon:yes gene_type:complete
MKITKNRLKKIIAEEISRFEEAEQPLQKLAKDIEKKGTEGDFSEWCGKDGVTQACIDRAAKMGGKRAKQASLAVTFSKAKGGGPSLTYPTKEELMKEGATNEEWEMVDAMIQAMGHENALESVIRALPSDTVKDVVKYVARMHEFDITPEEEKEYDAWTDVTDFFDKGEEEDLDENKGEDK